MFKIAFRSTFQDVRKLAAWIFFRAVVGLFLTACVPGTTQKGESQGKAPPPGVSADQLAVVDCVLPSRPVRLGRGPIILKPRQPIKTTVYDCEDQGGEQGVSPLEVWLPDAEKGDQVAQTQVGEIYAKGQQVKQDYARAAEWYRKAAEQGYARAQTNLGFLYEKGLGVPKDPLTALNWQRKASGLGELVLGSASTAELIRVTEELDRLKSEAKSLRQQLEQTQQQLKDAQQKLQSLQGEARVQQQRDIERLAARQEQTEAELKRQQQENAKLTKSLADLYPKKKPLTTGIDIGPYYALIIGNGNYAHLDKLETSINDAKKLDEILRKKYGFKTKILIDADRDKVAYALDEFRQKLTDKDNLLIYYSGHGQIDIDDGVGYWLPVDADPDKRGKWIQNEEIAAKLDIIKAKHVLVIADSCYSGTMTSTPIAAVPPEMTPEQQKRWIELISQKRSRTVFTSGGNEPVIAKGRGGEHSVFAEALLDALEKNGEILEGQRLYTEVSPKVALIADQLAIHQLPDYKTLKGHEGSEFIFVPETRVANMETTITFPSKEIINQALNTRY